MLILWRQENQYGKESIAQCVFYAALKYSNEERSTCYKSIQSKQNSLFIKSQKVDHTLESLIMDK